MNELVTRCMLCAEKVGAEGVKCALCTRPVHSDCDRLIKKTIRLDEVVATKDFRCSQISMDVKRNEVAGLLAIGDDQFLVAAAKHRVLNRRVGKQRVLNPDLKCTFCGQMVHFSDKCHILRCVGVPGTPIRGAPKVGSSKLVKKLRLMGPVLTGPKG